MLINKKNLHRILLCPSSGERLKISEDETHLICTQGESTFKYDILDDKPILVNFDKSILNRSDISSENALVKRRKYKSILSLAKKLVSPPKTKTRENVKALKEILEQSKTSPKVLIVGGGTIGQNMEFFYESVDVDLVSFDIYSSPNVQFIADAHQIPLSDNFFDVVIVQAVLEHVLEPQTVVGEIHRVLKEDGLVYAETPFLQHVHEGPYDFTRFTESGHRYLFKNFNLIDSGITAGSGTQLLWTLDYFARGLFRSRTAGKIVKILFFWVRYFDLLIPVKFNVDCASGVFFFGSKSSTPINPKCIPNNYVGAQ